MSLIIGFYVGVSLIMCYAAKAPAEYMKLAILHSQMIQVIAIMNMDTPDDFIEFTKSFKINRWNLDFLDFITLKDAMEDGTRRNLKAGWKNLNNLEFKSGNLFTEYIYMTLFMIFVACFHAAYKLLLHFYKPEEYSFASEIIKRITQTLEWSIYINIFLIISFMVAIVAWNEILGTDFNTGLNSFSYIVSLLVAIFLVVLTGYLVAISITRRNKVIPMDTEKDKKEIKFHYYGALL